MSQQFVIALDIGTSSTRALVFDLQGRATGPSAQIPYEQSLTPDGGVEVDAEFLLKLTAQCLDELLPQIEGEILGVAASCFWHSLLAVDENGKPLTGLLSWADNRAAELVPVLRQKLDEKAAHQRTGCVFHTSYWPAKLLWLEKTRPALFQNNVRWMGFGEFLALRWCGQAQSSLCMASGTGLFHQNNADWDAQMLEILPIEPESLPPLADFDQPLPPLKSEFSTRWSKLQNVPWFAAMGDGACSNLGSGCADETKIALNAGTSGALRVVLKNHRAPAPPGLWRYRVDKNRSIIGGAISNAGNALAWARETLDLPKNWETLVDDMAPGAHGLTVLPFLAGERAPLWDANARFGFFGATLDTTALHIVRAILEATALRFAAVANLLREISPDAPIVFSGGALEKVPVWQQIVCDAMGAPLLQSRESEASSRGAALLALESLGLIEAAQAPFLGGAQLQPNLAHHEEYQAQLQQQNALYRCLARR